MASYPNNIKINDSNTQNQHSGNQNIQQPTIRHIPIFVEGRDEPIINKNLETGIPTEHNIKSSATDMPGSIFNRVKNFPVRGGFDNDFYQQNINNSAPRAASPGRSIPINIKINNFSNSPKTQNSFQHGQSPTTVPPPPSPQSHQQPQSPKSTEPEIILSQPAAPPVESAAEANQAEQYQTKDDSIAKIQQIQKDVLDLMDHVEHYNGTSRRDKQYLYLDEMLTQNLLKLDTIDTEGKDNIKQARREAIKCINRCISVLEAKTDAAAKAKSESSSSICTERFDGESNDKETSIVYNSIDQSSQQQQQQQ